MYRVLGLLGLEVLGLTPVLILDVVLERLRFDSYFTLGSTLMLVFFGVEVLVGAWTGCLSFMEDFEAATDGFFTSSRIVLAACSALDGGRVSAGFPLASDEAFVALPEMVLPLVTLPLGPELFASTNSDRYLGRLAGRDSRLGSRLALLALPSFGDLNIFNTSFGCFTGGAISFPDACGVVCLS
jgi:hypothetical protein